MCLVIKIHEIEIATLQHCNIATLQLFGRVNGIWEGDIYIRISSLNPIAPFALR